MGESIAIPISSSTGAIKLGDVNINGTPAATPVSSLVATATESASTGFSWLLILLPCGLVVFGLWYWWKHRKG